MSMQWCDRISWHKFFWQNWLDLGKIKTDFGHNWGEIWAELIRFGQNLLFPKTFDPSTMTVQYILLHTQILLVLRNDVYFLYSSLFRIFSAPLWTPKLRRGRACRGLLPLQPGPVIRSAFFPRSPHGWCGPVALSPLLWAPGVRVSVRSAGGARPSRCPARLALSSQLRPLHWYMAWNGVTPI